MSRRELTDHDRSRLRTTRRTVIAGVSLGVALAVVVGVTGGSGAASLALLLLLSAAGSVAAALVTAVQAVGDEYRGRPVARQRAVAVVALAVTGVVLLAMSTGAAGAGR